MRTEWREPLKWAWLQAWRLQHHTCAASSSPDLGRLAHGSPGMLSSVPSAADPCSNIKSEGL